MHQLEIKALNAAYVFIANLEELVWLAL